MHWLWRAAIAFLAAWTLRIVLGFIIGLMCSVLNGSVSDIRLVFMVANGIELAAGLAVYGLLTRRYYQRARLERETRCRKCNYILRGISEPRCPECRERI